MERLTALDAEFLHLEDGIAHMHIAGMSVFEGPAPSESEVSALLASKLHHIPRYRQRAVPVPLELGRPVWVDDPHFDLRHHVRSTALVEPGDAAVLGRLMGRLMSQELDRRRPLWECWIVHGLPDGRWALISKVHHCMVDGIAGVGLLEALLDAERDAPVRDAEPWVPEPEPSGPALVVDAWGSALGDLAARLWSVPATVLHPVDTLRTVACTGIGLVRLGRNLRATPSSSVDGTIGAHRAWACSSASLDDVRRIRKSLGGTVNDVVLAAVTRGYRDLLLARGDDIEAVTLRTLVPVSLRGAGDGMTSQNRVSAILYELPVGIADPVDRLDAVRATMTDLKASHMPEAGDVVASAADLLPPMVLGNLSRGYMRYSREHPQRMLDTVTTNVPGPQFPLFCLGREMLEHRPFVPISHGIRVGTAILSYNGHLAFGITADDDHADDVEVVAAGIVAGIAELVERSS